MDPVLYPRRRHLNHSSPWGVEYPEFFLTICCREMGSNQLCRQGVGERVLQAARNYHEIGKWHCELMVLMPDHLHALISLGRMACLDQVIRSFKSWTAKDTGVIWQTGFFDHRLRDGSSAAQKWKYVNKNPVRAGLVKSSEEWPWSFIGEADLHGRAGRPRPADG
jgi:putative transposase